MKQPNAPGSLLAGARIGWRSVLLRAATSIALLGMILWWIPWQSLASAMGRISASVWVGTVAAFMAGHAVSAFKWRLLLGGTGVPISVALALRAHGLGLFANLCLPSLVGGDVVRAGLVVREHGEAGAVVLASLGDRVNDSLALLLLSGAGALHCRAGGAPLPEQLIVSIALLLVTGVVVGILVIGVLPRTRLPDPIARVAGRLHEAQVSLMERPRVAFQALTLSLAIQAGFVWLILWLATAIGIDQPAAVWFLVWPLAKLTALLPISLGGIGVREVALAALLVPFGVEAATAVAQSLCWEVVLIGSGLSAGTVVLALGGRGRVQAVEETR